MRTTEVLNISFTESGDVVFDRHQLPSEQEVDAATNTYIVKPVLRHLTLMFQLFMYVLETTSTNNDDNNDDDDDAGDNENHQRTKRTTKSSRTKTKYVNVSIDPCWSLYGHQAQIFRPTSGSLWRIAYIIGPVTSCAANITCRMLTECNRRQTDDKLLTLIKNKLKTPVTIYKMDHKRHIEILH